MFKKFRLYRDTGYVHVNVMEVNAYRNYDGYTVLYLRNGERLAIVPDPYFPED